MVHGRRRRVTRSWCRPSYRNSTSPTPKSERSGTQQTEDVFHANDLDTAPPEWRIHDVQSMGKVSTFPLGSITLGVAVGPRQYIADQLLGKADFIRAMHERVQLCQDPQTEFALLPQSLGVSRIRHVLRVHGHPVLEEQRAAEIYDEIGQRSLERLVPGLTEDSMTQATLSAGQSGIGHKRARDIAAPAHLGVLIAATPRIQAMIQDAVWAGLLPKNPLETCLASSKQSPPPTSAPLMTKIKQRQSCMFRRQPRQQTKPSIKRLGDCRDQVSQTLTIASLQNSTSTSQDENGDDMDFSAPRRAVSVGRSTERSFHGSLIGLDSGVL